MIDFTSVSALTILEGAVVKIMCDDNVLWQKNTGGLLPSAYQEVEWIAAAANVGAYLNLGFAYDKGAEIRLGQWVMNENTAYPFGAAENSGRLRCMFSCPYSGKCTIYGSNATPQHVSFQPAYKVGVLNELSSTFKAGAWVCANATIGYVSHTSNLLAEYTMTNELYLFAQNYNGTPRFGDERRISYFQYKDKDGNLICDLYPCYRKSDGVIGMYDKARDIFLANVGTGSFTKGANV